MPIRASEKTKYPPPKEWAAIRERILQRARDKCEWCGQENHSQKWITRKMRVDSGPRLPYQQKITIVLTIAHLDHDPANNAGENFAALCQRCHLRHDRKQHKWNAARTRARTRGQLEMDFLLPPGD